MRVVHCRMFLCLFAGGAVQQLPQGLGSCDNATTSQLAKYTSTRSAVLLHVLLRLLLKVKKVKVVNLYSASSQTRL